MSTIFDQDFAEYVVGENIDKNTISAFVLTRIIPELQLLQDGIAGGCYLPLFKNESEMYFDIYHDEEFSLYDDFIDEVHQCLSGVEIDRGDLFWKGRFIPNSVDNHMRFLAWRVFNEFGEGESFCAGYLSNSSWKHAERIVSRSDASQTPLVPTPCISK